MGLKAQKAAWATIADAKLSPRAEVLLLRYAWHINDGTGVGFPGIEGLAEALGVTPRTIKKYRGQLKRAGIIETTPRMKAEGRGRSSDVVWMPAYRPQDQGEDGVPVDPLTKVSTRDDQGESLERPRGTPCTSEPEEEPEENPKNERKLDKRKRDTLSSPAQSGREKIGDLRPSPPTRPLAGRRERGPGKRRSGGPKRLRALDAVAEHFPGVSPQLLEHHRQLLHKRGEPVTTDTLRSALEDPPR